MGRKLKIDKVGVVSIDIVINEIWELIRKKAPEIVKQQRSMSGRLGAMVELLRESVCRSSIGMYNGRPYIFTGKIYEPLRWEDLRNAVYQLMKMSGMEYAEMNKYLSVAFSCQEFIKSKELKINRHIVVFNNGVYDIENNNFIKHNKHLVQVTMSDFDYDPTAECRKWEIFLDQILPHKSTQAVLQEYMGCIFLDRRKVKLEHMLILQGSGSNGKGVIFETITGIVGKQNVTNFGIDALLTGGDQKKNLAMMNGKRLNYCTEIQALASGRYTDKLKALISGEPVEARAMYGENFMAYDIPLMVANCNQLPALNDTSYGMQRRLLIIPFEKIIPVEIQDTTLSIKLQAEFSGIFNWLMEGLARYEKRGYRFTRSDEIQRSVEEFTTSANNCIQFMYEREYYPCFESVTDMVPCSIFVGELYQDYLNWCATYKFKSKTLVTFGKDLAEAGYTKRRTRKGIMIDVYGEVATKMLAEREDELEKFYSARAGRSHAPLFVDGVMYGKGDWNAAYYAHVSRPWLTQMRITNKLEGCYHYAGSTPVYDIDKLVKRVEKLGAFVDQEHKISSLAQQEEERLEAVTFNETMKAIGQPFRKWVFGMISHKEKEILVPNEWEYNDEAASIALRENAERNLKNII